MITHSPFVFLAQKRQKQLFWYQTVKKRHNSTISFSFWLLNTTVFCLWCIFWQFWPGWHHAGQQVVSGKKTKLEKWTFFQSTKVTFVCYFNLTCFILPHVGKIFFSFGKIELWYLGFEANQDQIVMTSPYCVCHFLW